MGGGKYLLLLPGKTDPVKHGADCWVVTSSEKGYLYNALLCFWDFALTLMFIVLVYFTWCDAWSIYKVKALSELTTAADLYKGN